MCAWLVVRDGMCGQALAAPRGHRRQRRSESESRAPIGALQAFLSHRQKDSPTGETTMRFASMQQTTMAMHGKVDK
jgi:hypothetical protein